MSTPTYTFLPYLRQGLANNLTQTNEARAKFTVKLEAVAIDGGGKETPTPLDERSVEIFGPGDVVGIDPRAVIKTDPHNWITNFENNYLAYIDFYDEDYPWRYSPLVPVGHRLDPWLALVVLKDDEFIEGQQTATRPLPFITVKDATIRDSFFPIKEQLWAWAHVHVNGELITNDQIVNDGSAQVDAAITSLQQVLDDNPDRAYSRLLCPRKLKPSQSYHAFVIPSFESGRLAGAGAAAADIAAAKTKRSWDGPQLEFPYYYRWKFNTGTLGDFEYLVRMLKPKVVDSRVGRRIMDMRKPGANIKWLEDTANPLNGILRLGGALKVPAEALTDEEIEKMEVYDKWAQKTFPVFHPFQVQLATLLNLADDYNIKTAATTNNDAPLETEFPLDPNVDADPLITPPIYGKWHAMVERVYQDRAGTRIDNNYNWLSELNLDPRYRVAAHFGTRVVQENQEDYMEAAWEQIGDVLKVNTQVRFVQVALQATNALYAKHIVAAQAASAAKALTFTAPIHKRLSSHTTTALFANPTVFQLFRETNVSPVLLTTPMRRLTRPRGRIVNKLKKINPAQDIIRLESLITGVHSGEFVPSPPKVYPPSLPSAENAILQAEPRLPVWLKDVLRRYKWLPLAALILAIVVFLLILLLQPTGALLTVGLLAGAILLVTAYMMRKWQRRLSALDAFMPALRTPASVDTLPKSDNFELTPPEANFQPAINSSTDKPSSVRFKQSLKDMYRLFAFAKKEIPVVKKTEIQLPAVAKTVVEKINPKRTIAALLKNQAIVPAWILDQMVETEDIAEVMTYPKINKPMYEDLKKISDDLFLPNVQLIEPNSLSLLETNQAFIESYMVGLNHEFARELLWREYPTDQRGSYFRQFWDVAGLLKDPALLELSEEEQREPFYDIPKIHLWKAPSKLGGHDHRQKPGQPPREEVVLVVRGELLKKYPTAVIYAHKANWTTNPNTNVPDPKLIRSLHQSAEGDKEKPDTKIIKTPLYSAKIEPDIYFFGFEITVKEARGEAAPQQPTLDNAGWFFVIKERSGEPRFGFDIPATDGDNATLVTWNDLDWTRVVNADEGVVNVLSLPGAVTLPSSPTFPTDEDGKGQEKQYKDDKQVQWDANIDAAELAYILYQVPMMVCVHASEMLLEKKNG
jgi:hypothetical protein